MSLKFNENAPTVYTTEPYYDLFDGGYIKPEELLEADDAARVNEAIRLVEEFMTEAENNGLIELG